MIHNLGEAQMSTLLKKLIQSIFPRKTVNDVMSAFHSAVAELNAVAEVHAAEAEIQREVAMTAHAAAFAAEAEAARAAEVMKKLAAIVGYPIVAAR
jgi:hypothetical protein